MAGRMQNRFNMLIDVTVGGAQNLSKLASQAKRSATGMSGLNKVLKANNTEFDTAKQRLRDFAGNIKKVITTNEKLKASQKGLSNATLKQTAAAGQYAEQLKRVTAAQNKHIATAVKNRKMTEAELKARQKSAEALAKEKATLSKYGKVVTQTTRTVRKHKKAIITHARTLVKLKGAINKVAGDYIKFDGRSKKLKNQTAALTKSMEKARITASKLGKETKETGQKQSKLKQGVDKTTIALQKQTTAFTNLSQRINNSGPGWANLRKILGGIRNQILVLMFATAALRRVFGEAFEAARLLESSLKGLGTVALNNGNDLGVAEAAAINLTKSGLLNVREAAEGLKNLLSAGYGMDKSIKMMNILTDAASFNRQGTLALGQAVVGATQGIKNQNSIMVDNAGITKNLSIMQNEYAASIGTTRGRLDEAGKQMAIYTGLMKEGAQFAGDSSKVVSTMEGKLAKLRTQTFNASAALGNILKPALGEIISALTGAGTSVEAFLADSDKMTEWMNKSRRTGKEIADTFRSIAGSIKDVISPITFVLGQMMSLAGVAAFIIKVKTAQAIWNVMMKKGALLGKKLTIEQTKYAFATNLATHKIELINIAEKKRVTGLKAFLIMLKMGIKGQKVFNVAMRQTRAGTMEVAGGFKGMMFHGKRFWGWMKTVPSKMAAGGKKVAMSWRGAALALKAFGGAARVARVAVKSLLASMGPMLLAFMAFEVVIKIFDRIFGAASRAKEAARDWKQMAESIANLEERTGKASVAAANTSGTAGGLGMAGSAMQLNSARADLEDHHKKMLKLQKLYRKTRSSEKRADIQDELDLMQGHYDKLAELVQSENSKANAQIADYYDKKNSIIQYGLDHQADMLKKLGTDEIVETEDKFAALIEMEKQFMKIKHTMQKENAVEQNIIQGRLDSVRKNLEEERRQNFIALEDKFTQKISSLRKKIEKETAKATEGTWQSNMKAVYDERLEAMKNHLKDVKQVTIAGLDNVADVYRAKANLAAENFVIALAAVANAPELQKIKDEDYWGMGDQAKDDFTAFSTTLRLINDRIDKFNKETDPIRKGQLFKGITNSASTFAQELKDIHNVGKQNQMQLDVTNKSANEAMVLDEKRAVVVNDLYQRITKIVDTFAEMEKQNKLVIKTEELHAQVTEKVKKEVEDLTSAYTTAMDQQYLWDLATSSLAIKQAELTTEIAAGTQFTGKYNKKLKGMISIEAQKIDNDTQLLRLQMARNTTLARMFPLLASFGRQLHAEVQLLGVKTGLIRNLSIEEAKQEKALAGRTIAMQKLLFEEANWEIANKAKGAGLDKQIKLTKAVADEDAKAAGIEGELTTAMITAAVIKLQLLQQEKGAWEQTTASMNKYYQELKDNLTAMEEQQKFAETVADLQRMQSAYMGFAEGLKDTHNKINIDHRKMMDEWKEQRDDKIISQDQYNKLEIGANKYRAAQLARADKLALAQLYRTVGREIMAYAARKAAQSGNIWAAVGMLIAGGLAQAAINAEARKIETNAEIQFGAAEREWQREQDAVLGSEDDAGPQTAAGTRKFGGTIKAESLDVTISPTIVISGEAIFIGQGSVTEFQSELQNLILDSTQQAIDNREVDLSGVMDMGT